MSPKRLRSLEPEVRAYAEELVDDIVATDQLDLVGSLTFPLPGFAGLSLLGFPEDDYGLIKEWSSGRVLLTYGHLPADRQIEIAKNVGAFWRYVEDHVASRDAERADDFTSDILGYRDQHPDAITTDDIVNIVYSMALAGHDSTTNAMGNALRHLLSHRDQWQRLIDDPSLIPNAVEELLRFDGPVLGHRRTAAVDTEIGGVPVPAGSKLVLLFASAAHDGEHFVDPQTLDVGRENADEHLAFGKGVHFCLGAPLARLELRIVLELLTDRTPAMTLVDGQPMPYQANALFRSVEQLLVRPRG